MPTSFAWQIGPALGMTTLNLAVPGTSIQYDEIIGQIERANLGPSDIVIFLTGINNMRGFGDSPDSLAIYKQFLWMATQKFMSSGAQIYLGTTPAMLADGPDAILANHGATPLMAQEYTTIIKQDWYFFQANEGRLHIVDVNGGFIPDRTLINPDLVHPSPAGHTVILNLFLNAIHSGAWGETAGIL